MSDMTFQTHMLACDWPECDQTTDPDIRDEDWLHTEDGRDYCPEHWHIDDEWIGWPSYEDAIEVLEDLDNGEEWYHDSLNRRDYCGRHWHWEDDEPVPGPDPEDSKNFEEQA